MNSPFTAFRGVIISLVATTLSVGVVYYFYLVVWTGQAPDYDLMAGQKKIPPESYPILLLSAWTLMQRANAHWGAAVRNDGLGMFFRWEDVIEAVAVAFFLVFTLGKALAADSNMTFIIVLIAFLVQAIGDLIFNARHRFEPGISVRVPVAGVGAGGHPAIDLDGLADHPVEIPAILKFTHMRLPDGSLRPIPRVIDHEPASAS